MSDMIPQGVQREGVDGGYERGDANIRSVVVSIAAIISVVLIVMVVAMGAFFALRAREEAKDVAPSAVYAKELPPEPRLLPSPLTKRDNILPWERGAIEMTEQKAALTRYEFTDKARGQVTIPVEQAMRDVIQENLPARVVPANRNDLASGYDTGAQPVADADLDGSSVPDTTGGRVLDDEAFAANKPLGANDVSLGSGNLAASSSGETITKSVETGASDTASRSEGNGAMNNSAPRPRTTTSAVTTSTKETRNTSTLRRDVAPLGAR